METDRPITLSVGRRAGFAGFILPTILVAMLSACESSANAFGTEHNGGLRLSEQLITLRQGETSRLAILERVDGGQLGTTVEWSSGNPWVAPVDDEGLVYAAKPGMTTVYASDGEVEGSTRIKVQKTAKTLHVEPEELRLAGPGAAFQLSAFTENAAGKISSASRVNWKSLDPDIVTVDGDGVTRAMSSGAAKVVAQEKGAADTASIAVGTAVEIATVSVTPGSATLATGDSIEFHAAAYDPAGEKVVGLAFSWTSSEPDVATVSGKGFVKTWTKGGTQLTATPLDPADGQPMAGVAPGTAGLQVKDPERTITVTPDPALITGPGASTQLTATVLDANGSRVEGVSIEWLSLNPEVVDVDATGRAVGVAVGTAAITAAIAFGSTDTVEARVESAAGATDGQAWVERDFESYASDADVRTGEGWIELIGAESQSLDYSSPPPGRTRSLRYHWDARSDGCYSKTVGRGVPFPEAVYEVWTETWVRFGSSYSMYNSRCSPGAHKLIFGQVDNGNYRFGLLLLDGGNGPNFILEPPGSAHLTDQKNVGSARVLFDGQWHRIGMHMRTPSGPSVADGLIGLYVDGRLMHELRFASESLTDRSSRIPIRGLLIGRNKDDSPDNTAADLWVGGVSAWRSGAGW